MQREHINTLCSRALRCLMGLALALGLLSTSMFGAFAETAQAANEDLEPVGLWLRAYPVDASMNWTGSKTTTLDGDQFLRLSVGVEWNNGVIVWQHDETTWDSYPAISGFEFTIVEGNSVSVPTSTGLINGTGVDGDTTIKAVLSTITGVDESLSATITITATHQESNYDVSSVRIVDNDGESIGSLGFTEDDLYTVTTLYVKITYKDRDTGEKTVVGNYGGQKLSDSDLAGLQWNELDAQYASLVANSDGTASFKPLAEGSISAKVTKYHDGDSVTDKIPIAITFSYSDPDNHPSDTLTINVAYRSDPDTILKSVTWDIDQFEALGLVTYKYTLTRTNGYYATTRARGVTMERILQEIDVSQNDVYSFKFAANDGANPGEMTANWLIGTTRFWLPNFDIGGSAQEREVVPTMIAEADCWLNNEIVTDSAELNSGTRFRLVFGSSTKQDNATSKSLKWINTMTVLLSGGPEAGAGDDDEGDGTTGGGTGSTDPGDASDNPGEGGTGDGDGTGGGGDGDGGTGSENPGDSDTGYGSPVDDSGDGGSVSDESDDGSGVYESPNDEGAVFDDDIDAAESASVEGAPMGGIIDLSRPFTTATAVLGLRSAATNVPVSRASALASTGKVENAQNVEQADSGAAESGEANDTESMVSGQQESTSENGSGEEVEKMSEDDLAKRWRIYQMMNNNETDLDSAYDDNPLMPFLIPAVLFLLICAMLVRRLRFGHMVAAWGTKHA